MNPKEQSPKEQNNQEAKDLKRKKTIEMIYLMAKVQNKTPLEVATELASKIRQRKESNISEKNNSEKNDQGKISD